MDTLQQIWNVVWNPLAVLSGALLYAIGSHLWRRFVGRMATVRWWAQHQSVATAADHGQFGRIEVRYNDQPMANVHTCIVQIENESGRDLVDLKMTLTYMDGTEFLSGGGVIEGGADWLLVTERFSDVIERLQQPGVNLDRDNPDVQYVLARRQYQVPVFNRGGRANFGFLVHAPAGVNPELQFSCVHPGVRVRHQQQQVMLLGVSQTRAAAVGLAVALGLTFLVPFAIQSGAGIAAASFSLGAVANLLGVAAIHLYRLVARLLT